MRRLFKVQGAALECMQCRPDVRLDVYDWLILSKPWGQSAQSAISWCADIHIMALRQARSPKQERVKTMENIFCIEREYKTIVSVVRVLTVHIPLPFLVWHFCWKLISVQMSATVLTWSKNTNTQYFLSLWTKSDILPLIGSLSSGKSFKSRNNLLHTRTFKDYIPGCVTFIFMRNPISSHVTTIKSGLHPPWLPSEGHFIHFGTKIWNYWCEKCEVHRYQVPTSDTHKHSQNNNIDVIHSDYC